MSRQSSLFYYGPFRQRLLYRGVNRDFPHFLFAHTMKIPSPASRFLKSRRLRPVPGSSVRLKIPRLTLSEIAATAAAVKFLIIGAIARLTLSEIAATAAPGVEFAR